MTVTIRSREIIHIKRHLGGISILGIYLLDNDPAVIDSTKKAFPWREHGFDVIGSHTDPGKAMAEIVTLKPALVIYEWRIGGVRLINKLRAAGADCEFAVLTDYKSFTAVRDFFVNGKGLYYLLKPLDKEETEDALARLRKRRCKPAC